MMKNSFVIMVALLALAGCGLEQNPFTNNPDGGGQVYTWYRDGDGDGAGNPAVSQMSATSPGPGWVLNGNDCDDTNPRIIACPTGCNPACNANMHCVGTTCVPNMSGMCTEGATATPDDYCRNTYCPSMGKVADHLVCDPGGGSWSCVCATTGTCSITCPTGTHCVGTTCVNDSSCTPTNGGVEACDGIDNNCNGVIDEGCMTPVMPPSGTTVRVKVRCDLPASFGGGAYGILLWNPYVQDAENAAPGCFLSDPTGHARFHQCEWTQSMNSPVVFQARYDLCHAINYCDQQSGLCAAAPQTRIWACTQEQASPITPFDTYGSCQVWINDVPANFSAVDNASGPKYPDGPRCGNGCNFAVNGFNPPRNICTP
jgi:hypothetical protein